MCGLRTITNKRNLPTTYIQIMMVGYAFYSNNNNHMEVGSLLLLPNFTFRIVIRKLPTTTNKLFSYKMKYDW